MRTCVCRVLNECVVGEGFVFLYYFEHYSSAVSVRGGWTGVAYYYSRF